MIVPFSNPFPDTGYLYAHQEGLFSKEECNKIIKIGKLFKPKKAPIGKGDMSKIRTSKNCVDGLQS